MNKPLRVLLVEDSPRDADLITHELRARHEALYVERVENGPSMRAALKAGVWDVVISDWNLPAFSAPAALEVLRETGLDLPFIIASGSIGEEVAVEAMRAGAHDYVVKGKLARLPPAVEREMKRSLERRAERERGEAHRQLERRYRRIIETANEGIIITDTDDRLLFVSRRAEQMFGYEPGELLGRPTIDLVAHADLPAVSPSLERRRRGVAESGELKLKRKDGAVVWVLRSSSPILDDEGRYEGMFGMLMDITEKKRAEESLRQTERQLHVAKKMEAIGNLAGGVAHDFNNLLSIILSYSTLLAEDMAAGDPRRADLEEIQSAGKRAEDLTRQLLAFGRQQILQPRVVDLNEGVAGMERMLRRLIGEDIELTVVLAASLGRVLVDPGQVDQIIMNLAVNSRDAMPGGGKLTIETANVELDAAYAAAHAGTRPGPHVLLAVTDTGMGMDEATLSRMFEPFFTTKEQGKGTGLGLATVFGIVHQSGGSVWVYSEPGQGTTFKVYFPRTDVTPTEGPTTNPPVVGPLGGTETILMVEDDNSLRVLAGAILQRCGYHVIEAQSGGDALLICEQHPATIHLLLTDVVMPRMSGRQLAERLHPLRPTMKVLYMSGYTNNSIVHHGVLDSGVAFLQKPITPEALARKVREVLNA